MPVPVLRSALALLALWLTLPTCPAQAASQEAAQGGTAPAPATDVRQLARGLSAHRHAHVTPPSTLAPALLLPGATAALGRRYPGPGIEPGIDVLQYHYDSGRTGWNSAEEQLTPATVASSKFGLLKTLAVDGNVFAQPLLARSVKLADASTHDMLVIATGHDSVYAYDANSYAVLWHRSLGTPQRTQDVGCGDVQPEYGISSTPIIQRGVNGDRLFVVSATETQPFSFQTQLHELDLKDGMDAVPPVVIAPSATLADGSTLAFDPQNQWSRAGLATWQGAVYISIGSHCDSNAGNISGWVLRYDSALRLTNSFHTILTPHGGTELASIWMSGFAPAIDGRGQIYAVTGNGDMQAHGGDWGESALELTPTLSRVASRFTPRAFAALNNGDTDFGSGGIMILPPVAGQTVPAATVAIGKAGVLYLLQQGKLGGLQPDDGGALQATPLSTRTQGGVWGGPAYYQGPDGPIVYLQTDHATLTGFRVSTAGTPGLTPVLHGTTQGGYGGALPIVSSSSSTPDTGVVWMVRRSAPMELEAYDARKLGAPLFHAQIGIWSNPNQNSFLTPMEANGRVYAPGYKVVQVFGLE